MNTKNDVREDIEAAIAQHEESDNDNQQTPSPAPAPTADVAAAESAATELATKSSIEQPKQEAQKRTQPLPQDGDKAQVAQPSKYKPPVSWKPEAREHWSTLKPELQQEIMRREREVSDGLRQASEARRFHNEFMQMAQPFMGFIAAENSNPIQAAQYMFQTAALLRVGTPQQKVDAVAGMIKQFGIDLNMLDQSLAAIMGSGGQQIAQPHVDPAFQQFQSQYADELNFVRQLRQQAVQSSQQTDYQLSQTLEDFMQDERNEFIMDVKDDMADILDLAAKRGTQMSLSDAYNRAILLHPTISKIVEQRRTAQSLASQAAVAQQARRAAVSPGSAAPSQQFSNSSDPTTSVRSAIEAAFEKHEMRTR